MFDADDEETAAAQPSLDDPQESSLYGSKARPSRIDSHDCEERWAAGYISRLAGRYTIEWFADDGLCPSL